MIAILTSLFVSVIRFSMKNEISKLKLDAILDFFTRLIHATGTLEFDRFPDLYKLLPTDSQIQSFFHVLVCFKKLIREEKRREKF